MIVIQPGDVIKPDGSEKPTASKPFMPTLATEPIRWNPPAPSAAQTSQETANSGSTRESAPADDAQPSDTDVGEAERDDAEPGDAGSGDAAPRDTGSCGAGSGDAEPNDTGSGDAETNDTGSGGAGSGGDGSGGAGSAGGVGVLGSAGAGAGDERWREIMVDFVDDPHASVEAAATLIEEEIAAYVARLADRQESMRSGWSAGRDTEVLRLALRRYRDFRLRLLREAERVEEPERIEAPGQHRHSE